jgi:two-component system, sensor histidine kinase RegB
MMLLIQLRWIAVIGQIATIAVVQDLFRIDLPLAPMLVVIGALVALNLTSLLWLKHHTDVSSRGLLMVLVLDVAALTAQLYLSGGATNPFTFLYLLQITIAAVLLDAWSIWAVVALAFAGFGGLTVLYRPLALPHRLSGKLFALHTAGMLVCFVLDATLLVVFVILIMQNLRRRDARLAALRQHAIEEDHVVRLGLLASGAAHELGTPLALLSVVLGDWRRMRSLAGSPGMLQEIDEMQAAVQRCKSIVSGILKSSGEAGGDAPAVTTVNTFLDALAAEWRISRSEPALTYQNSFGTDVQIVSDTALKQIVFNVLDNALEASPSWVGVEAAREDDALVLRISDRGPGFAAEMLEKFGKPYQSSKGRPGGGLGLFLVVNVVRKLGGTVAAQNRSEGGAAVTLNLPLATLAAGGRNGDRGRGS